MSRQSVTIFSSAASVADGKIRARSSDGPTVAVPALPTTTEAAALAARTADSKSAFAPSITPSTAATVSPAPCFSAEARSNPGLRQEIEYDARAGKIFGERGQLAYTVTVLRDLSSLRRMAQLKVERRMLEIEKFAATGRLAATIAHEVNNPMEAIKNAIYLLSGAIPESAAPVYNILKSETERVARIVRQMLGLYRKLNAGDRDAVEDTLKRYDIAWTILAPDSRIVAILDQEPGWRRP